MSHASAKGWARQKGSGMTRPSVAATIGQAAPAWRAAFVAGLVTLGGALAIVFGLEQRGEMSLAWWWPTAAPFSAT